MVKRVLIAILISLHGLKGVFLETRHSPFAQNDHLKPKLSPLLSFCDETSTVLPFLIRVFYSLGPHKKYIVKRKKSG